MRPPPDLTALYTQAAAGRSGAQHFADDVGEAVSRLREFSAGTARQVSRSDAIKIADLLEALGGAFTSRSGRVEATESWLVRRTSPLAAAMTSVQRRVLPRHCESCCARIPPALRPIAALSVLVPRAPTRCIYFICAARGGVLYVGQSVSFWGRLARHDRAGTHHDVVLLLGVPEEFDLDATEKAFIAMLRPPRNFQHRGLVPTDADRRLIERLLAKPTSVRATTHVDGDGECEFVRACGEWC